MSMQDVKDRVSLGLFNMTLTEAHKKGICLSCKKSVLMAGRISDLSEIDLREWKISGLCPKCWLKAVGGPE